MNERYYELLENAPDYAKEAACLGYLECDMLADALKEYAAQPQDVAAWIEELFATESEA